MTTKTFFLPPNFLAYPAATESNPGPIRLGQLISNINDPGHTIGTIPPLNVAPYDMPINIVNAGSMGHTDKSSSSFFANLFLQAIELIGAKLSVNVHHSHKLLSVMETVESQTFDPKDTYVAASMQQPEVQTWLKQSWGRRRVYMVCGILIARPADDSKVDISTESSQEFSGEVAGRVGLRLRMNLGWGLCPRRRLFMGFC
ncbi:hypothetical protein EJ04DRAFT_513462 [Polyplosphaeria fusca]|uniref:Uncharacterized protein n=1 Tax=Polyplosphaeria fusca TaxID=682080 RepID=A0A9P4QXM9_9PLEO|nr:hypothetical protein EJ04DRAFT_513462 [Polyplosphaeria fusca]